MRTSSLLALSVVLSVGLAIGATPAPAAVAPGDTTDTHRAASWTPTPGPVFNDPTGNRRARTAVIRQVHAAIRRTPPGGVIRLATYNIDRADTARLLLRAKRRGVAVQVVVNDNLLNPVILRLRRRLGKDPDRASFLVVCREACRNRSRTGNLHVKVYTFSQTGAARAVLINSSSNLGRAAADGQWNEAYTVVGHQGLYDSWAAIFDQLKRDRAASPRYVEFRSETVNALYQRPGGVSVRPVARAGVDPHLQRLRQVGCSAPVGFGVGGRTTLRINMYAWYGARGERIARQVAALQRAGCRVRVIGSVVSAEVVRVLRRARIPVRVADWDWGDKPSTSGDEIVFGSRCYGHLKHFTVNGTFRGRPAQVVVTGSENWSAPGLSSDEVTFEISDPAARRAYDAQWQRMWSSRRATHAPGVRPTSRPCH